MIYNSDYNNLEGYWSPVTSNIDWCEENYTVSRYIAEFWNTISNGIFVLFAIIGMFFVKKYHYEERFFWAYFGLLCVGIGSWLFHMTLQYQMELMDELPMIYTCCIAVFCIFEITNKKTYRPYITLILWMIAFLFTIMYIEVISWPWFQHGATIFLIGIIVYRSLYVIHNLSKEQQLYSGYDGDSIVDHLLIDKNQGSKIWISYKRHLKVLKYLLVLCAFTYTLAFLLWNIDNIYCIHLLNIRNKYNQWSFLFQFHAWWHIFTGIGTYGYFIFCQYLRNIISGIDSSHIKWLFHLIPYVAYDDSFHHTHN